MAGWDGKRCPAQQARLVTRGVRHPLHRARRSRLSGRLPCRRSRTRRG